MTTTTITGLETLLERLEVKVPIPQFVSTDVLRRPLDIGRSYLADIFCSLLECDPGIAYKAIHWPNDISSGDLAVILPKLIQGADLNIVGFDITKRFPERSLFILPFQDGVHLRIMFNPSTLPRLLLPYMNDRQDSYGRDESLGLRDPSSPEVGRKKLLIEFSSPNIASEFQSRHLRSTIIGAYIANQYENMGWEVTRLNYLGDWGKPMGLLGVAWEKFGSEELFQADPAGHLHDIYHKILELFIPEQAASKKVRDEGGDPASIENQGLFAERNAFFKRMQEDDEQAVTLWKRAREVNIKKYTELYARLNVTFDEYSGESQVRPETMTEVEDILKRKGILEESAGSWMIDLKKHSKLSGTAIIRDRTGSSTYLLRDLAAVLERSRKYSFDKMIYVVAADQHTTHFSRLFTILELMDMADMASKLQHVNFSNVSKMSEKLGHDHTLDEILDQVKKVTYESLETHPEMAAVLGHSDDSISSMAISALVAGELSTRRAQDHSFEVGRMTSFEPGTGPHLQYWYTRLCTVLNTHSTCIAALSEEGDSLSEEEFSLLRLLVQFPDISRLAYESLESSTIMTYLSNLAVQLSSCLDECEGQFGDSSMQANLYDATRRVMESGMRLLGVIPGRTSDENSAQDANAQSGHSTLPEENSHEDTRSVAQEMLPDEETSVSQNAQPLPETTIPDSIPVFDEVQSFHEASNPDEIAACEDVTATEAHSSSNETPVDDESALEASHVCEQTAPDTSPVDNNLAVADENVPEVDKASEESVFPHECSPPEDVETIGENTPEKSFPDENMPITNISDENKLVENILDENAPVENMLDENIPDENVAVKDMPNEDDLVKDILDDNSPVVNIPGSTPNESILDKNMQDENIAVENTLNEDNLVENIPNENNPGENIQDENNSVENILDKNIPDEDILDEKIQNENIQDESIQNENIQDESIQNENIQNENIQDENIQNENIQDKYMPEEFHDSQEESPEVPLASEDVPNATNDDSHNTLAAEGIQPSVEIQVM